jgi:hypothetical protein
MLNAEISPSVILPDWYEVVPSFAVDVVVNHGFVSSFET